jgi:polyisoprenoid-binding protein YceI
MTPALLTIDALNVRVPVGTWTIDPAHSSIGFSVRHLILQRHLSGSVASSAVVAETGLVLASAAPSGPVPDVVGGVESDQDQLDQQAADLG